MFLPPGARATVVVQAGASRAPTRCARSTSTPARRATRTRRSRLGTFIVAGTPVGGGERHPASACARARPPRADPAQPDQLARRKINRTRYIDFSESADGNTFFINSKTYDENRVDTTRASGRDRALDRPQLLGRAARLPPAPDRVPGHRFSGTPDQTLGPGHARRDQHPLRQGRQARRGRADHPVHQPGHGRASSSTTATSSATRMPA